MQVVYVERQHEFTECVAGAAAEAEEGDVARGGSSVSVIQLLR